VDLNGTYTVNNVPASFTQKVGATTSNCTTVTCTCTTALPCTGVVATCSLAAPVPGSGHHAGDLADRRGLRGVPRHPVGVDHMQTNGASIWEVRSTALSKPQKEECLICHGPNRLASISLVHTDRTP
jgi:hypothetical protein